MTTEIKKSINTATQVSCDDLPASANQMNNGAIKPIALPKSILSYAGIGSSLWGNTTSQVEATIRDLRSAAK